MPIDPGYIRVILTPMETAQTTIKVGKLTFQVSSMPVWEKCIGGLVTQYTLRGTHGAVYKTVRYHLMPDRMFLKNDRKGGFALEGRWFTDKNGKLEVL